MEQPIQQRFTPQERAALERFRQRVRRARRRWQRRARRWWTIRRYPAVVAALVFLSGALLTLVALLIWLMTTPPLR